MESFLNSRADRGIIYQGTDFSVDILYSLLPVIIFLGRKMEKKIGLRSVEGSIYFTIWKKNNRFSHFKVF